LKGNKTRKENVFLPPLELTMIQYLLPCCSQPLLLQKMRETREIVSVFQRFVKDFKKFARIVAKCPVPLFRCLMSIMIKISDSQNIFAVAPTLHSICLLSWFFGEINDFTFLVFV